MREILFRGKDIINGEWVSGFLVDEDHIGDWINSNPVRLETVGQFTGLTDRNGKKIFEGDILRGSWDTVLVIFYDEPSTSYRVKTSTGHEREPSYYGIDRLEIIGNIHDNPEQMEV